LSVRQPLGWFQGTKAQHNRRQGKTETSPRPSRCKPGGVSFFLNRILRRCILGWVKNPKHQPPNSREAPNFKSQNRLEAFPTFVASIVARKRPDFLFI
jgi:hypothetical protein